jgi:hypothetical protein
VSRAFFYYYFRISVHLTTSCAAWYGAAIQLISCTPHFFLLRQVYWNKDVSLEDQKRVGGLKRRAGALKEENNRNGVFSEMAYATLQGCGLQDTIHRHNRKCTPVHTPTHLIH